MKNQLCFWFFVQNKILIYINFNIWIFINKKSIMARKKTQKIQKKAVR